MDNGGFGQVKELVGRVCGFGGRLLGGMLHRRILGGWGVVVVDGDGERNQKMGPCIKVQLDAQMFGEKFAAGFEV